MKEEKQNIVGFTLNILRNNFKTFLISFLLSFVIYSFLYGLWIIPFIGFGISRMSEVTIIDYLFIFVVTLIVSILITLVKYEKLIKIKSETKSFAVTGGTVAGLASAVCPVCQGVVLIALGSTIFNIPLGPMIPYLGVLKIVTLGLLILALFLKTDSIYTRACTICKIMPIKKKVNKK